MPIVSFIHTGKSTTLKNVLSVYASSEHAYSQKSTASGMVKQAAYTTLPIGIKLHAILHSVQSIQGIDDIKSPTKLEELVVEFFNGFTRKTVSGGESRPKTGLIITSNCAFTESQRLAH